MRRHGEASPFLPSPEWAAKLVQVALRVPGPILEELSRLAHSGGALLCIAWNLSVATFRGTLEIALHLQDWLRILGKGDEMAGRSFRTADRTADRTEPGNVGKLSISLIWTQQGITQQGITQRGITQQGISKQGISKQDGDSDCDSVFSGLDWVCVMRCRSDWCASGQFTSLKSTLSGGSRSSKRRSLKHWQVPGSRSHDDCGLCAPPWPKIPSVVPFQETCKISQACQ